jgi:hypothetical protein
MLIGEDLDLIFEPSVLCIYRTLRIATHRMYTVRLSPQWTSLSIVPGNCVGFPPRLHLSNARLEYRVQAERSLPHTHQ